MILNLCGQEAEGYIYFHQTAGRCDVVIKDFDALALKKDEVFGGKKLASSNLQLAKAYIRRQFKDYQFKKVEKNDPNFAEGAEFQYHREDFHKEMDEEVVKKTIHRSDKRNQGSNRSARSESGALMTAGVGKTKTTGKASSKAARKSGAVMITGVHKTSGPKGVRKSGASGTTTGVISEQQSSTTSDASQRSVSFDDMLHIVGSRPLTAVAAEGLDGAVNKNSIG